MIPDSHPKEEQYPGTFHPSDVVPMEGMNNERGIFEWTIRIFEGRFVGEELCLPTTYFKELGNLSNIIFLSE